MDQFNKNVEIARTAKDRLGGLCDEEFRCVEQLLHCFAVPRVEHALVVLGTIGRIFVEVPWAQELAGLESLAEPLRRIGPRVKRELEAVDVSSAVSDLRGDFLESRSLIEPKAVVGADALRLVLVVCTWTWSVSNQPHTTARSVLGRAIRTLDKVPVEGQISLLRIAKAMTVNELLRAADGLASLGGAKELVEQWALNFEPTLLELARRAPAPGGSPDPVLEPAPPAVGPSGAGSRPKGAGKHKPRLQDVDAVVDKIVDRIQRVRGPRPPGVEAPELSESPQELDPPLHTATLLEAPVNRDARAVLRRQIRQTIWNSNHLLLPDHPAVLRWPDYVRVISRLMADLTVTGRDAEAQGIDAVLLLHALTGRTVRALQSMEVVTARSSLSTVGAPQIPLDQGAIRIPCFWQEADDESDGPSYFRPEEHQRASVEGVRSDFLAPLIPPLLKALPASSRSLAACLRWETDDLAQAMRDRAAEIAEREGFDFTIGQLRASFAAHLFEDCRDVATTQLIAADALGQSTAPLSYYAPRAKKLAACFWSFQCRAVGEEFPMPAYPLGNERIGSHLLATLSAVERLANATPSVIRHGVSRLLSESRLADLHDAITTHTVCMLLAVTTHRPTQALFDLTVGDFLIERDRGAGLFRDKIHDGAHDPRLVALPKAVVRQLHAYLSHLAGLAAHAPAHGDHVGRVLASESPLFFRITVGGCVALDLASFKACLPELWRVLPLNWGRHWMRTRAIEAGIRPELVNMQLGHLEAVGYPFSGASPTEPWRFVEAVAEGWGRLAQIQGWEVFRGLKAELPEVSLLPPLRQWSERITSHLAVQRQAAVLWQGALRAKLRSYRERAMTLALGHPEMQAAGIPSRFTNTQRRCEPHNLRRADFERIRDELFAAAGDDLAFAIASADAVCRIAGIVNRRSSQRGETPGRTMTLRRPLDNAFIPGLMTAVRQVNALRQHVATLGGAKAGDRTWSLEIACAHAVLGLCLFGYVESVEQAMGALRHRSERIRSRVLPDLVLVPYGSEAHQVLGLRGVAAIVIAKLAKNFSDAETPSTEAIDLAVVRLLPDWAVAGRGGRAADGWLNRLFETCAMANRYELSPAARLAHATKGGSTSAHIEEQAALVDGDPAGLLRRSWETASGPRGSSVRLHPSGPRKANARSQYLALCAVFPGGGVTELPVTGCSIPSGEAKSPASRRLIVDELRARLRLSDPVKELQPIVRVLTEWTIDMLKNGTPLKKDPALSSVETYLSRLGGVLVHIFGQSSLEFLDEVELEEAYLAAIESKADGGADARSKIASMILHFQSFASAQSGFPEVDLSEVRLYLRKTDEPLADARLVLPSEREAAIAKIQAMASAPIGLAAADVRVHRQAVFAMTLMGSRGLRRSEPLGLQFRDVTTDGSEVVARIRPNHSRRLKTQNARRVVRMRTDSISVYGAHLGEWIETERYRIGRRRLERALVFSATDAPFSAEQGVRVAGICLEALREATGRPDQRLHALRHMVGMEQLTPVFLTSEDRAALAETFPGASTPTLRDDLALPRDLQGQVIPLGHGNPRTTLLHYHHLPWLLRSRSDARLSSQYVNRATLAPLLGVTLHAMDFAVKKHPDRPRGWVWLDIAAKVRPRPSAPGGTKRRAVAVGANPSGVSGSHAWSACELSKVLEEVGRVGDLEKVLLARGAFVAEAAVLRQRLLPMERRLGRRLLVEEARSIGTGVPKRVLRPMRAAAPLNALLAWFDGDEKGRRAILESIADDLFEHLHPKQGDRIVLSPAAVMQLVGLLEKAGLASSTVMAEADDGGLYTLRIRRSDLKEEGVDAASSDQYLGLALKRLLIIIRASARDGASASSRRR